jgi:hypothetical protein
MPITAHNLPDTWTDPKGRTWSGWRDGFTDSQGNPWTLVGCREDGAPLFASPGVFRNLAGSTIAGIYAWLGPLTATFTEPASDTPEPTREQAAENLGVFLRDMRDHAPSWTPQLTVIGARPDLDQASRLGFPRFAFEVESAKRERRFVVLMPGLPLAQVRRLRADEPAGLEERERIAVKVADRRACSWKGALSDCAREADYQTPAEAIAGLLGRF